MTKRERAVVSLIPSIMDLPQCEAARRHPYANDTDKTDKRCKRKAKINYRGTFLCMKHAEVYALHDALTETSRKGAKHG